MQLRTVGSHEAAPVAVPVVVQGAGDVRSGQLQVLVGPDQGVRQGFSGGPVVRHPNHQVGTHHARSLQDLPQPRGSQLAAGFGQGRRKPALIAHVQLLHRQEIGGPPRFGPTLFSPPVTGEAVVDLQAAADLGLRIQPGNRSLQSRQRLGEGGSLDRVEFVVRHPLARRRSQATARFLGVQVPQPRERRERRGAGLVVFKTMAIAATQLPEEGLALCRLFRVGIDGFGNRGVRALLQQIGGDGTGFGIGQTQGRHSSRGPGPHGVDQKVGQWLQSRLQRLVGDGNRGDARGLDPDSFRVKPLSTGLMQGSGRFEGRMAGDAPDCVVQALPFLDLMRIRSQSGL